MWTTRKICVLETFEDWRNICNDKALKNSSHIYDCTIIYVPYFLSWLKITATGHELSPPVVTLAMKKFECIA